MLAMGGAMSAGAEATVGVPRQKGSEVLPLSKESSMKLPDGNEVAINMLWKRIWPMSMTIRTMLR